MPMAVKPPKLCPFCREVMQATASELVLRCQRCDVAITTAAKDDGKLK